MREGIPDRGPELARDDPQQVLGSLVHRLHGRQRQHSHEVGAGRKRDIRQLRGAPRSEPVLDHQRRLLRIRLREIRHPGLGHPSHDPLARPNLAVREIRARADRDQYPQRLVLQRSNKNRPGLAVHHRENLFQRLVEQMREVVGCRQDLRDLQNPGLDVPFFQFPRVSLKRARHRVEALTQPPQLIAASGRHTHA